MNDQEFGTALRVYVTADEPPLGLAADHLLSAGRQDVRRRRVRGVLAAAAVAGVVTLAAAFVPGSGAAPEAVGGTATPDPTLAPVILRMRVAVGEPVTAAALAAPCAFSPFSRPSGAPVDPGRTSDALGCQVVAALPDQGHPWEYTRPVFERLDTGPQVSMTGQRQWTTRAEVVTIGPDGNPLTGSAAGSPSNASAGPSAGGSVVTPVVEVTLTERIRIVVAPFDQRQWDGFVAQCRTRAHGCRFMASESASADHAGTTPTAQANDIYNKIAGARAVILDDVLGDGTRQLIGQEGTTLAMGRSGDSMIGLIANLTVTAPTPDPYPPTGQSRSRAVARAGLGVQDPARLMSDWALSPMMDLF